MITVVDIYAVASRVRSETLITYEPLMLLAVVYMAITGGTVLIFRWLEGLVPVKAA
jgi:polar amino acid transport system permease protein